MFKISELIYIIETIYNSSYEEEYRFKKVIQDKLNSMNFKDYKELLEKCDKIALSIEENNELNKLNNLHTYIIEKISNSLDSFIK